MGVPQDCGDAGPGARPGDGKEGVDAPSKPHGNGDVFPVTRVGEAPKESAIPQSFAKSQVRKHQSAISQEVPYEECYPPRDEEAVKLRKLERERQHKLDLLRQIEERRLLRQQRRQEAIKQDLVRLGRDERLEEYQERLNREQQEELRKHLHFDRDPEDVDVSQLRDQLERQHLQDKNPPDPPDTSGHSPQNPTETTITPSPPTRQVEIKSPEKCERPSSAAVAESVAEEESIDGDAREVVAKIKLDERKPWGHYRLLEREMSRRRHERAALEAAREAAARRRAEVSAQDLIDRQHKGYLDWRSKARGRGRVPEPPRKLEEGHRWAEQRRQVALHQRAERDVHLQEWRKAKQAQEKEKRAVMSERQMAAAAKSEERRRQAASCFTRWLADINQRKMMENAIPLGATGVTTYNSAFSVPWSGHTRSSSRTEPANRAKRGARAGAGQ